MKSGHDWKINKSATDKFAFNCFLEAAKIVTEEGPTQAGVGDSVKLKCKISGNPTPSTIWYKDGRELKPGDKKPFLIKTERDSSQLEIESAQISDKGRYTCFVRNDLGEDKRSFYLAVVKGNTNSELLPFICGDKIV